MREYLEWQEFYELEPFGLQVTDAMHAHQISMLANVNRNAEKRPEPFEIKDFLMFPPETRAKPEEEPTVDGLTADEWGLLHFFQAAKVECERRAKREGLESDAPRDEAQNS